MGPHSFVRYAAEDLLRRGDDLVSLRAPDSHLRLPEIRRAVPRPAAGECRAVGGRQRHRGRVSPQTQRAQGGSGPADPSPAGRSSRAGLHLVGDGTLLDLQAVAQQEQRQDLSAARRRQVPALLLLLPRRRARAGLRAGADLAAVPAADLLQRALLVSQPLAPAQDRFPAPRQRLCGDQRLEPGAADRQRSGD